MITEICGTTPDASTLRWKTSAYPASEATPSWIRAPPESLRPITGAPSSTARSITLQIFSACASESAPPKTVKSCEKTKTRRPFTVPWPVTTPSPAGRLSCIPKSTQRCVFSMSNSRNEPSSRRSASRSRAVSLPLPCCLSIRVCPPPSSADASRSSSRARTLSALRCAGGRKSSPPPSASAVLSRRRASGAARRTRGVAERERRASGVKFRRSMADEVCMRVGGGEARRSRREAHPELYGRSYVYIGEHHDQLKPALFHSRYGRRRRRRRRRRRVHR